MQKEFIGYHGTYSGCFIKIKNNGFRFSKGENDWLGWGVYFYEDYPGHAVDWCVKVKKFREYDIISVYLRVDEEELLDLTNPEEMKKFKEAKRHLIEKISLDASEFESKKVNDCFVLNYIAEKVRLKLIRQAFITPPYERSYSPGRIVPTQIQLCAKDVGCIRMDTLRLLGDK